MKGSIKGRLILVRHSLPAIQPGIPAAQWRLSPEGRARAAELVPHLAPYLPSQVLSSEEPKASETAQILATGLDSPYSTWPDLHEHLRATVPYTNRAIFTQKVAGFFSHPERLFFGEESAETAYQRFNKALENAWLACMDRIEANLVIVSHGTVISLWVGRKTGLDPFQFWQQLGMPSYIVIRLPELEVEKLVTDVGSPE